MITLEKKKAGHRLFCTKTGRSNFYHLRVTLNLSQKELAKLLKISRVVISHYETGRSLPSVEVCRRIIKVAEQSGISINLEYLLDTDFVKKRTKYIQ